MSKLWGGRFQGEIDKEADRFHSSVMFDQRLWKYDILGSIAHVQMLGQQEIIAQSDSDLIAKTLGEISADIENGLLQIDPEAEDIHSFIETELTMRIGDTGKRLHTGRSRNDQVSLDMRMYLKDETDETKEQLKELVTCLLHTAKKHARSIMPGYTHMQKAQPITIAHHLMAYVSMFIRDIKRLDDARTRMDVMPLGSGALASTTYPIDREYVCRELDFADITANSLDAVSDRDFCIELLSCHSIIMMHLSRFCEELVLWSTEAFGYIEISDAYTTGSSIMPQKKNPDMAELIRGKTGRVYGSLMALLTVMKGLPLSYNTDLQEDKEAVFDSLDTVKSCLAVFTKMFEGIKFNTDRMYKSTAGSYANATDVADWLVKKGVTFREAHEITGKLVLRAIEAEVPLDRLPLSEYQRVSTIFDKSVFEEIGAIACVEARCVPGGPASVTVFEAIRHAEDFLSEC